MFNHPPKKCDIYLLQDLICTTNNSCVYSALVRTTREKVILKFLPINDKTRKYAENECAIQESLHHPFIMLIKNSTYTHRNDKFNILQMAEAECSLAGIHEYIPNINLIYKIMYQSLLAISYLHEMRILHGDIKPENFVLMKDYLTNIQIRVIDFGHAHKFDLEDENCITDMPSGTTTFNSPELLIGKPHSFPSDIWSLGATFYYLITGESVIPLNDHLNMYEYSKRIYTAYTKKFGKFFPSDGKQLISNMLSFDPNQRPTAKQCLEDSFFINHIDPKWIAEQHILVNQMVKDNTVVENILDNNNYDELRL